MKFLKKSVLYSILTLLAAVGCGRVECLPSEVTVLKKENITIINIKDTHSQSDLDTSNADFIVQLAQKIQAPIIIENVADGYKGTDKVIQSIVATIDQKLSSGEATFMAGGKLLWLINLACKKNNIKLFNIEVRHDDSYADETLSNNPKTGHSDFGSTSGERPFNEVLGRIATSFTTMYKKYQEKERTEKNSSLKNFYASNLKIISDDVSCKKVFLVCDKIKSFNDIGHQLKFELMLTIPFLLRCNTFFYHAARLVNMEIISQLSQLLSSGAKPESKCKNFIICSGKEHGDAIEQPLLTMGFKKTTIAPEPGKKEVDLQKILPQLDPTHSIFSAPNILIGASCLAVGITGPYFIKQLFFSKHK